MKHPLVRLAFAALLAAAPLQPAMGQASAQLPATSQPVASSRTRVFSINPLGIPFETVSVEFENLLTDAFTIAGNFSYFSPDDFTRTSFEVKGRLYPNELAPRGFSVALGLGGVNTRENIDVETGTIRRDKTYPSIAVYVDHNWLLGRSDRFFVGTGVGAKRILGDDEGFDEAPFVYPTARFLIGVAF